MSSYKLDPAATSTYGSTNLTDLTDFSYTEEGTETTLGTDGKPYLKGSFIGDISYNITVNGIDPKLAVHIGEVETLTLKGAELTNGSGVAAGTAVFTFANAVCTSVNPGVNHIGNSTISMTFRSVSSDGAASSLTVA